jgi:hypothetical protein
VIFTSIITEISNSLYKSRGDKWIWCEINLFYVKYDGSSLGRSTLIGANSLHAQYRLYGCVNGGVIDSQPVCKVRC